jgi:hypothetical protein
LALGLFDDRAGNDAYGPTFPSQASTLGIGHDLSGAVYLDEQGDDTYVAPGLTLGTAIDNGLALSVNQGGNDKVRMLGSGLGSASSESSLSAARQKIQTVAVFIKAGGSARYDLVEGGDDRHGKSWCDDKDDVKSVGLDTKDGSVTLR